jgi:hypothetical protein
VLRTGRFSYSYYISDFLSFSPHRILSSLKCTDVTLLHLRSCYCTGTCPVTKLGTLSSLTLLYLVSKVQCAPCIYCTVRYWFSWLAGFISSFFLASSFSYLGYNMSLYMLFMCKQDLSCDVMRKGEVLISFRLAS